MFVGHHGNRDELVLQLTYSEVTFYLGFLILHRTDCSAGMLIFSHFAVTFSVAVYTEVAMAKKNAAIARVP